MAYLVSSAQKLTFADYAEKYEIFPLFEHILQKLIVARPVDPIQFMIDTIRRPVTPAVIVFGPPASGKGTLCKLVAEDLDVVHISTGDLLRTAIEKGHPVGAQAKPYMEKGLLVPDSIMGQLVVERLKHEDVLQRGWVLDGFPRTREQGLALQREGIIPKHFVHLEVSDEVVIQRMSGRRLDPVTGKIYHLAFDPPQNPDVAARLIQRSDDTESAVRMRLALYRRNVPGVLSAYAKQVRTFNADQPKRDLFEEVISHVTVKPPSKAPRSCRIVVLGRPGAGKTTQSRLICAKYKAVYVSVKEVVLAEIASRSVLGDELAEYAKDPDKAPAEAVMKCLRRRLARKDCAENGWLLDGFPRTKAQAESLRALGVEPNLVLLLDIPATVGLERITSRRFHVDSGEEISFKSPNALSALRASGLDPAAALAKWIQRKEDTEGSVLARVEEYEREGQEIAGFYRNMVQMVDADHDVEGTFEILEGVLIHN